MSRHVGRKQRWREVSTREFVSDQGRVERRRDGWYGVFAYQTPAPPEDAHALPTWQSHAQELGPFKRPRDAMVALEREVTFLRNRHGQDLLLGGQYWAET